LRAEALAKERRLRLNSKFAVCLGKIMRLRVCKDHWWEIISSVTCWHSCLPW